MKYGMYVAAVFFGYAVLDARIEDFKIVLEPRWQNLDSGGTLTTTHCDGKWILIGSITFEKKAKEPVNLTRLYLNWKGEPLANLLGSLYKKFPDKDFLPIQENLVCDGSWNTGQQTLMLDFDKQQTLGLRNTFYLVLTIPEELEPTVKKGSFNLVHTILPEPFQPSQADTALSLTLDVVGASVQVKK